MERKDEKRDVRNGGKTKRETIWEKEVVGSDDRIKMTESPFGV
jgi:hypothetical protein